MIPPPDDTSTIPTPLLAAYDRLWREMGKVPIDRLHHEAIDAYDEVRRIRNRAKYGHRRRSDAK